MKRVYHLIKLLNLTNSVSKALYLAFSFTTTLLH